MLAIDLETRRVLMEFAWQLHFPIRALSLGKCYCGNDIVWPFKALETCVPHYYVQTCDKCHPVRVTC